VRKIAYPGEVSLGEGGTVRIFYPELKLWGGWEEKHLVAKMVLYKLK